MKTSAIGIFDSGLGGLTVAREIAQLMPHESQLYVGDQARCPYGPRDARSIQVFVHQIASYLSAQKVKAVVIACNTASAVALDLAKQHFDVPVIGVIDAGAQVAASSTATGRIAVIGTALTIDAAAHAQALAGIDPQLQVSGHITPELTTIVEAATALEMTQLAQKRGDYYHLVESYVRPVLEQEPDTLLLGCTHYPVLADTLRSVAGDQLKIVSGEAHVARQLKETLDELDLRAALDAQPQHRFLTTGTDLVDFDLRGSQIFGADLASVGRVEHLELAELTDISLSESFH